MSSLKPVVMVREQGRIVKRWTLKSDKKASRLISKLRARGLDVLFFLL